MSHASRAARAVPALTAALFGWIHDAHPLLAQRAGENVVTAAEDAFGSSLGNERIGLYNASEVRGFSPLDAGNVRIEGFAFDPQGSIASRLVEGSTVRVGITAQGYPFPAPTGIVDYRLRQAGDEFVLSLVTGLGDYGGPFAEADAKIPIVANLFSLAAGASYSHDEYYDGSDAHVAAFALVPRLRLNDGVEVRPFAGLTLSRDEEVAPFIVTEGAHLPPRLARRQYYAQPWADLATNIAHVGCLVRAELAAGWYAAAAVYGSIRQIPTDHAELFIDTQPNGRTREQVIADPPQRQAAAGGEAFVTWSATEGPRLHRIRARIHGRLRDNRLGGSSEPLDLGERTLGTRVTVAEPAFQFRPRTHDRVHQWTAGLAYEGRWKDVGEIVAGLQKTFYRKTVDLPSLPRARTESNPWLANATLSLHATESLAAYAGFARGLEESGIAPGNAANRNQALPAILTQQLDAGLRYAVTPEFRLVAGVFEVRKPNFTTDERNVFTELGVVRHQGIELSMSGELFEGFTVVAGAVLMRPRVRGPAVDAGRIGERPVGQTDRTLRANLDYRIPWLEGLSLDLGFLHTGERVASSDNRVSAPSLTTIDLGARYRFSWLGRPAAVRVLIENLTDAYGWRVMASNTFRTNSPRSISANFALDL